MKSRMFQLLEFVKDYVSDSNCSDCGETFNNENSTKSSYEYKCLRCGLTLEFNRNQTSAKCPNDGSTMYRI